MGLRSLLLLYTFFMISPLSAIHVCVVHNWCETEAEFFNPSGGRDEGAKAIYLLKQRLEGMGHRISTMETVGDFKGADYIVWFNYIYNSDLIESMSRTLPADRLFLFLWEPPSVDPESYNPARHQPFGRVYTWKDDLVDGYHYRKFFYPSLRRPMIDPKTDFKCKKLCTLIACNKTSYHPNELYSERLKIIQFFDKEYPGDFDLYGPSWPSYSVYRGTIKEKAPVLEQYRFGICYENIKDIKGYVTEKIFDCFYAGCVPIYWGASNVADYIPQNCYIDRRAFKSNRQLYQFLKKMSREQHQSYLNNIKAYLESPQCAPYTANYFVDWFVENVLGIES